MSNSEHEPVTRIGDVLVPTFAVPNPLQRDLRYTVTSEAQRRTADHMLRSGRWVIETRGEGHA